MRFRILLAAASAAILAGCVSTPSGHMANGFYIDDRNAFQMAVPSNWKQVDELPYRFTPESRRLQMEYERSLPMTLAERKSKYGSRQRRRQSDIYIWNLPVFNDAVFINDENTAAVILRTTDYQVDFRTLTQREIKGDLLAFFALEKHMVGLVSSFSNYTNAVSPQAITDQPTFLARNSFTMRHAKESFRCEQWLYHHLLENRSRGVRLSLISEEPLFEKNLVVLEEMTKTLQRHTPPPRDVR